VSKYLTEILSKTTCFMGMERVHKCNTLLTYGHFQN
jgi:putative component of membrane protein insertase Oxa1/YidC/SpoIIIJ protein YidD